MRQTIRIYINDKLIDETTINITNKTSNITYNDILDTVTPSNQFSISDDIELSDIVKPGTIVDIHMLNSLDVNLELHFLEYCPNCRTSTHISSDIQDYIECLECGGIFIICTKCKIHDDLHTFTAGLCICDDEIDIKSLIYNPNSSYTKYLLDNGDIHGKCKNCQFS